jgi:DNA-binding NtrC family response regulator
LHDDGHEVETAESGNAALALLRDRAFDLVITDLRMPGGDGMELLRAGRSVAPDLEVLLTTAYASIETAVEAIQSGACDYLQKPFHKNDLVQRVRRVGERLALRRENRRLRDAVAPRLYGDSPPMQRLRRQVERLAGIGGDVLVTGESGTGKELVARALHYGGESARGPFVAVNCAAIPDGLAESEIFGHEKGAFTHAVAARAGKFEQADGGTLFLDEVSSMPPAVQAKLLRVLQERVVERVGSGRSRRVDVRVVAAANRDLGAMARAGEFRADLYHRLDAHEIHVPPLRERGGDIRLLAELFRDRAAQRFGVPAPALGDDLLAFFARYPFPGNVRELQHIIDKMVVLSEGEALGCSDLPPSTRAAWRAAGGNESHTGERAADAAAPPGEPARSGLRPEDLLAAGPVQFADVERRLLAEAIRRAGGNWSEAARQLGMSYKTLRYRAAKFGLDGDASPA